MTNNIKNNTHLKDIVYITLILILLVFSIFGIISFSQSNNYYLTNNGQKVLCDSTIWVKEVKPQENLNNIPLKDLLFNLYNGYYEYYRSGTSMFLCSFVQPSGGKSKITYNKNEIEYYYRYVVWDGRYPEWYFENLERR